MAAPLPAAVRVPGRLRRRDRRNRPSSSAFPRRRHSGRGASGPDLGENGSRSLQQAFPEPASASHDSREKQTRERPRDLQRQPARPPLQSPSPPTPPPPPPPPLPPSPR